MAVTAIKGFHNRTPGDVIVRNEERDVEQTIKSGKSVAFDIWIPWAADKDTFKDHHVTIEIKQRIGPLVPTPWLKYWIWQHHHDGDDLVRQLTTTQPEQKPVWSKIAGPVSGKSEVGGDRFVDIHPNGFVEFIEIAS